MDKRRKKKMARMVVAAPQLASPDVIVKHGLDLGPDGDTNFIVRAHPRARPSAWIVELSLLPRRASSARRKRAVEAVSHALECRLPTAKAAWRSARHRRAWPTTDVEMVLGPRSALRPPAALVTYRRPCHRHERFASVVLASGYARFWGPLALRLALGFVEGWFGSERVVRLAEEREAHRERERAEAAAHPFTGTFAFDGLFAREVQ